jgi:hypothetical protein
VKGANGTGMGGPTGNGPARCQSIIMWSIEGQEYPQDISYVCSPDQLPELAPEMDAIADKLFKIVTDAGLKCGTCLRPQNYSINPAWKVGMPLNKWPFKYQQAELDHPDGSVDVKATAALLIKKAKYAYDRWGCATHYGHHISPFTMYVCDKTINGHGPNDGHSMGLMNGRRVSTRLLLSNSFAGDMFYVDSTSFDFFPPFTSVKLMPGSIWEIVRVSTSLSL